MISDGVAIRNIIVMRPRYVGDVLLTVPVLHRLKEQFPEAHLCFLADPAVKSLIDCCPYVDSVLVFDRKGVHKSLAGRFRFMSELKQRKFDLAVILLRSFSSALYAFLAGIPIRAGFDTERRGLLLTHRTPYNRDMYETDCFQSVVDTLGIDGGGASLEWWPREDDRTSIDAWLKKNGCDDGRGILFINPGPSGSPKSYDSLKFARVADRAVEEHGAVVVITWGPGEKQMAETVLDNMKQTGLLAPPTDLLQLAALLERGRVMVTTDTGPLHLAAAVGLSTVALFGPTNQAKWNPRSDRHEAIKKEIVCWPCNFHHCNNEYQCMDLIEIEDISGHVTRLWNEEHKGERQ